MKNTTKLNTAKRMPGSLALFGLALSLLLANCLPDYTKQSGATGEPGKASSEIANDPALYPHVESVVMESPYAGSGTKSRVRILINFDRDMDATTINESNIYALDVDDNAATASAKAITAFAGTISYFASTRTAVLEAETDSVEPTADTVNMLYVSEKVSASNGMALIGNIPCDLYYCEPNSYKYVLDSWDPSGDFPGSEDLTGGVINADGSGSLANDEPFVPNDASRGSNNNGGWTIDVGPGTGTLALPVVEVTFDISDYNTDNSVLSNSDALTLISAASIDGSVEIGNPDSIVINAGNLVATFNSATGNFGPNTQYRVTLDTASDKLRSKYVYPNGTSMKLANPLSPESDATLFLDRHSQLAADKNDDTATSDYQTTFWTKFDTDSFTTVTKLPKVKSKTATRAADNDEIGNYSYVGGESDLSAESTCFSDAGTGNGAYQYAETGFYYVGAGQGRYIYDGATCGGAGTHNFDNGNFSNDGAEQGTFALFTQYVTVTFNVLMDETALTASSGNIIGYTGPYGETTELQITLATDDKGTTGSTNDDETIMTLQSKDGKSLDGFIIKGTILSLTENASFDGNDGADAIDAPAGNYGADGAIQGQVDSNFNGRYDDHYYYGVVPAGLGPK